ncbi:glycosyltransferase EpsF [Neobacillus niacini]|uniref:glycosyltransferase family 1 protein n=1 Tax=Neobacillus niacini TaxID=86668 RepID=UPI0028617B80|nr:glycosyltransferase family 1 protein [Neobacillus niacini]MDR7079124.1 glycosyltransferase EpsF [Neobacillus niacini]
MKNSKPYKVLHVVGAMNQAGTETMLMNIYRNIDRKKFKFDFVSYSKDDAYYDNEIKELGGRVIKLTKTQSIKEIYTVIKDYGPYDAVHSHTLFHCGIANIAAKLADVKIRIAHAHTTFNKSDNYIRKGYYHFMRKAITVFSTHLLACSQEAGTYLYGEKGIKDSKYSYFPNLINYSKFFEAPKREILKFKSEVDIENNIVVGHVGRFIESKNHLFLLEILYHLVSRKENIQLLLVGDGKLRAQIERIAIEKGLIKNIRFVGVRDDIHTMFHSMDIFVFPSIYEGLGLVLLEAQASGLPCIVSEAIQPEANLGIDLFSTLSLKGNPSNWANKILELAGKREKDVSKIIKGFEKSGYSIDKGISKLTEIYSASR